MGNSFHQTAVTGDHPGPVIYQSVLWGIKFCRELLLGQGHAHGHGEPLAQRTGSRLNTRALAKFRVPCGLCVQLPEVFKVLQADVITREVQQGVEQHRAMPI